MSTPPYSNPPRGHEEDQAQAFLQRALQVTSWEGNGAEPKRQTGYLLSIILTILTGIPLGFLIYWITSTFLWSSATHPHANSTIAVSITLIISVFIWGESYLPWTLKASTRWRDDKDAQIRLALVELSHRYPSEYAAYAVLTNNGRVELPSGLLFTGQTSFTLSNKNSKTNRQDEHNRRLIREALFQQGGQAAELGQETLDKIESQIST